MWEQPEGQRSSDPVLITIPQVDYTRCLTLECPVAADAADRLEMGWVIRSRGSGPGKLGGACRDRVAQGAPDFFNLSGPPGVGTPRGPEEQ